MPADVLSPVSTLCLAILHRGDATGYEIKKESVDGDDSYFIDASYGSIYPALARLAAEGLVTLREETQSGRPSRKVYSITDTGRDALLRALSEPPGPDVFRSRFLLVAKFARELPANVVADAVAERKRHLTEEIAHLDRIAAECSGNPCVEWVIDYGRVCMGTSLKVLDERADELIAIGRPPIADAAE
ncbi:PadR family transcriptional regulator [Acuticoccus sp. MNP-M23]|uniref:PadR family transcriptional regulator n=1 Tax=Acuticoccus sp. MNP-M23 TaxID=3072793 RepID=UPI002815A7BA|nr:PadR family transcriptional regulator [Acuticoccus sp. MNP-M23]WMS42318.1 PadR family transcriptional regulator [Acuticoccus sp. MNP-M23]